MNPSRIAILAVLLVALVGVLWFQLFRTDPALQDYQMPSRETDERAAEPAAETEPPAPGRPVVSGVDIDELIEEIQEVDFDYDAERIARTEINGAQNEGAFDTERELGVQYHEWVTAQDDRVRGNDPEDVADHTALHGVIVAVGDPFPNGLTYPGERIGDEAEWINCRCRAVPFIMPEGKRAPTGMDHFTAADLEEDE